MSFTSRTAIVASVAISASACLGIERGYANPLRSLYTAIDLKECTRSNYPHAGVGWLCPGLKDWPVYVGESEQRQFLSFGRDPEKRTAATQTLAATNSIFRGKKTRATIEWRLASAYQPGVKIRPRAVIVRHFTTRGDQAGEVLVIYKVSDSESCEIGIIDALANTDANALARSAADEFASTASCRTPPRTFGQTGRSPM